MTIVSLFALYGAIILVRKIMLPSDAVRQTKGALGKKFYIEPYRRQWSNCTGETQAQCNARNSSWIKWVNGCCRMDASW